MKIEGAEGCYATVRAVTIGVLMGVFLFSSPVSAGQWRVSPIKLKLDRSTKSGVITVVNEGSEKLHVQIKAAEWTQDAEGRDQYTDTSELIFFPRIMVLDKMAEQVVRVGIRVPPAKQEKTYRLFIEEIPRARASAGATISVAIKFGVPIFVKPLKGMAKGVLEKIEMSKGVLTAVVTNEGARHFTIDAVRIVGRGSGGATVYSKDLSGWYVLSGARRVQRTTISPSLCKKIRRLTVKVEKDTGNLNGTLHVTKRMCAP